MITAPGESDVTCTVTLAATNIGDGDYPSTVIVGLVPVEVVDNDFATGVDKVSKTADSADIGYQEDFWIMAPSGSPPAGGACENDTYFHIPVDESVALKIEPDESTATPDAFDLVAEDDPASLDTEETLTKVTWHGTSADTADNTVQWKFGPDELEIPLPIKVKTMKNRTVRVAVHEVASRISGQPDNRPDLMPTEAGIQMKLNEIFGFQINAWFDVEVLPVEAVAFDVADGDSYPDFTFPVPPDPGNGQLDFRSFSSPEASLVCANRNGDYDIHIYVVGGGSPIFSYSLDQTGTQLIPYESALGLSNLESGANYCIIDGDRNAKNSAGSFLVKPEQRTVDDVLLTMAHEIGHIMVGGGHPDEEAGDAPLPGTDRSLRLMCSGTNSDMNSKLLVKAEWDAAEVWLKNNVDKDQP